MAKIRIKGDTSGYIDIAAPAVAGSVTLNLPTSDATFMTTAGGTFTGNISIYDGTSTNTIGSDNFNNLTLYSDQSTSEYITYKGGIGHIFRVGDTSITDTSGAEAVRIDASGNVGIGTSTSLNSSKLVVGDGSGNEGLTIYSGASDFGEIYFADGTTGADTYRGYVQYNHSSNYFRVGVDAAERMRIDSSGNLLVGTTNLPTTLIGATSGGGIALDPDSYSAFNREATSSNQTIVVFNNTGVDAKYFLFRKDGSSVGSIGVDSSAPYFATAVGSTLVGIKMQGGSTPRIIPTDGNGDSTDGVATIGFSSQRFKDLYLSGGVYLGGTGSANHLDDYEEGTFTPGMTTGTVSSSWATYTKIGKMVTINVDLNNFSDTTSGSLIRMTGLPFTAISQEFSAACHGERFDISTAVARIAGSTTDVYFRTGLGSSDFSDIAHSTINNGPDSNLRFTLTYFTDS